MWWKRERLLKITATVYLERQVECAASTCWKWRQEVLKCVYLCTRRHDITYQDTAVFIFTAVVTANFAYQYYCLWWELNPQIGVWFIITWLHSWNWIDHTVFHDWTWLFLKQQLVMRLLHCKFSWFQLSVVKYYCPSPASMLWKEKHWKKTEMHCYLILIWNGRFIN